MGRVPRYYEVSQAILKNIFKTHVNVAIFLYYTLTITYYNVEGQDFRAHVDGRR